MTCYYHGAIQCIIVYEYEWGLPPGYVYWVGYGTTMWSYYR